LVARTVSLMAITRARQSVSTESRRDALPLRGAGFFLHRIPRQFKRPCTMYRGNRWAQGLLFLFFRAELT
jgi:hypothetical protein